MSDVPPRRPIDPESERELELDAAAYERNVPGRLEGFRGTNPIAFVIAGVLGIGIILFAAVAFLHRGAPSDAQRTAQLRAQQASGPAAPGLGGPVQTPFIPAGPATVTPAPASRQGLIPIREIVPQTPLPIISTPESQQQPVQQAQQIVPAPAVAAANGQMRIDQPASPGPDASNGAAAPSEAGTHYVPVYRNGKIVSVVEVANSPVPAPASSTSPPVQQSSQFMSAGNDPAALGQGNAGLLEARKFDRANNDQKVGYVAPSSVRQLAISTVLNARLMSKIESDLPGPVIAQITEPVYDSNTHTTVVVPAGTRVFGKYDEETVASSTRLLMSFTHLIFPDGEEFDIGGQPGTDSLGTAGFTGDVDQHRGALYTSALLLTVLGAAEAAVTPQTNILTNGTSITQQAQSSAGAQLDQLGNKILDRAVDRPATIIVRPPYAFQIVVTRDLPLDEYETQHQ